MLGFVLAVIESAVSSVQEAEVGPEPTVLAIEYTQDGTPELVIQQMTTFSNVRTVLPIPPLDRSGLNKILIEVASLSDQLYSQVVAAYDATGRVDRIRAMILGGRGMARNMPPHERFQMLAERAESDVTAAFVEIKALYKLCTGTSDLPIRNP